MPFCFATITSTGYLDDAAGLWANLGELYPDYPLVVCAIDDAAWNFFGTGPIDNLKCVTGRQVWGDLHWKNLTCRTNQAERAYACKSALSVWVLENFADTVILLDCDLLFLERTDDLISMAQENDVVLTSARHDPRYWDKSNRFGLFSAGIVGFSQNGVRAARSWKAYCFDYCLPAPAAGLYNEQKYLDYLVGSYKTAIIRDEGINVSATVLPSVRPVQIDGKWVAASGTTIRVFHLSRATDANTDFGRRKRELNEKALSKISSTYHSDVVEARNDRSPKQTPIARLARNLRIGRLLEGAGNLTAVWTRRLIVLHRIFSQHNGTSLIFRAGAIRAEKRDLLSQLDDAAFGPLAAGDDSQNGLT